MKYRVFVDTNILLSGILTGDAHFFNDNIKSIANVVTAKDFFAKIK